MSIYVGSGRINYPAMRGPCPYGYHVPMRSEWSAIRTAGITLGAWTGTSGTNTKTYLKLPFPGYRNGTSSSITGSDSTLIRCCEAHSVGNGYDMAISNSIFAFGGYMRSGGGTIRPFKDEPVVPTSSWTTLYDGSSVATGAGIFWNSSSGIISISSDGTTRYTIADKNLGATTVYNNGDTLSEANCGKFFQRGNNYPFAGIGGSVTTSSTKVDASAYGPGNWYYSSTFIKSSGDWSSVQNDNLRGGVVGAVKADVKDICVGAGVNDYSSMQGPCPDGFHILYEAEFSSLRGAGVTLGAWTTSNGTGARKYLKMPFAGSRGWSGSVESQGTSGNYWMSVSWDTSAGVMQITQSAYTYVSVGKVKGFSIRPMKNEPVAPDNTWTTLYDGSGTAQGAGIFWSKGLGLISISADGTTWYTMADKNLGAKVVYNDGDTLSADNCGGYFQWGNNYMFPYTGTVTTSSTKVSAIGYGPGNYYNSSTFITASSTPYTWDTSNNIDLRGNLERNQKKGNVKQVYVGTTPARPTYNPGIYWNKTKGLISISSDGKNWITIADKNLGAKVVYNDGDTLSQDNCGLYYQWGNNYGFAWTGSVTTSTTKVNTSTYSWQAPYYGSTFIKVSASPYDWSTSTNYDLWGDTTNTLVARQGPCPAGRHIPTQSEEINIINYGITLGAWTSSNATNLKKYLKCPFAGYRSRNGSVYDQGTYGHWVSSSKGVSQTYQRYYTFFSSTTCGANYATTCDDGNTIRPFKNEPVVPDNSRAVLYQPS